MSSMMGYKGYHATVEYDADDKIFIGEVFGIVDSLNFHGSSVDELEEMFHQSIDNYLCLCKEYGKEPDKEFRGTFNVRIPSDLHRKIALEATRQSLTLNQYVTKALERSFDNTKMKETIVYMPYSSKTVSWDIDEFPQSRKYDQSLLTDRLEASFYVGN